MTRIDRYLLVIYFRVLSICFLSIAGLMVIVQIFNNLTEFIEYGQQQKSIVRVLIEYFGPYTLTLFDRLSGLLALMALLFAITWIYRTNEMTALLAAGVTKRRIMRPLLIASACVIGLAGVSRELWIPSFQDRLDRKPQDLKGDLMRSVRPTADWNLGVHLQARNLLLAKRELIEPMVRIRAGALEGLGRQVLAATGSALPATAEHPAGFLLKGVHMPRDIDTIASIRSADGKPLFLTRNDTPWLAPGECFLVTRIDFEMLRSGASWKQYASTAELISNLRSGETPNVNEVLVQIHSRFVRPLIDWTVLLLGIPVVLTRPDRHVFWVAGVCILLVGGFTAVVMGLNAAGGNGYLLSPLVAAWLPLLTVLPWSYQKTAAAMET
ncbi:MAG: LptF/LptG family permease [Pirellulaceae bacterium]|nr:LptF/LptG family permease [Pirellulaceae bacterium]